MSTIKSAYLLDQSGIGIMVRYFINIHRFMLPNRVPQATDDKIGPEYGYDQFLL
jgi:hypothetical protein